MKSKRRNKNTLIISNNSKIADGLIVSLSTNEFENFNRYCQNNNLFFRIMQSNNNLITVTCRKNVYFDFIFYEHSQKH